MARRPFVALGAAAVALFCGPALAADCPALQRQPLEGATVTSAELTPAGSMTTPVPLAAPVTLELPEFCRVKGMAAGAVGFEVWLPTRAWNGRILSVGSAGFGGDQPLNALAEGLRKGFAVTSNDTGHQGADPGWMTDPAKVRLWGHSATHLAIGPAKRLVAAYYGAPARWSYFEGCSTGGAQAMTEAQSYPDDFDGIVAGAPGMSYAHLMMSFLWGMKATQPPGAVIPPEKLQVLHTAVLATCDGDDGLKDGLVSDPLACRFRLSSVTCEPGARDTSKCLTPAQALTAQMIYSGPRNSRTGASIYPGFAYGSETDGVASPSLAAYGWGAIQGPLAQYFAIPLLRTMVFRDPAWDWRTFDWDADVAEVDRRVGADITALSPDLDRFRARGGKLLMHQGWGDQFNGQALPILYRGEVIDGLAARSGARHAEATVDSFFRVFMAPGVGHCFGGPGFVTFDALGAVQAWVETGVAPAQLLAYRSADPANGAADAPESRPICAYPKIARYKGAGSPTDPASFTCVRSKAALGKGRS